MHALSRFRAARVSAAALVAATALLQPAAAPAADALTPPGDEGFSEHVLTGIRLSVGPRGAALAPDGTLHVVYGDTVLRHAWNDGSGWQTETLDAGHARGGQPAVAIDADGDLHIAYCDPLRGDVFHGLLAGATFESSVVASNVAPAGGLAIAVAADGAVHLAWSSSSGVSAATDASGAFVTETVTTDFAQGVDLALDESGAPHLAFQLRADAPYRRAVHAARTTSGWELETVESGIDVGGATSLAFDADGVLHVVHTGEAVSLPPFRWVLPLRHAVRSDSGWTIESLPTPSENPRASRIVVDASGDVHVASADAITATYYRRDADGWTATTVGTGPYPVFGAAMVVDGADVHVAWSDPARVFLSTSASGATFETTAIDHASVPLLRPSAGATSAGRPVAALVRGDADGTHIDVVAKGAAGWTAERAASGVSKAVRPALRAGGSEDVHVAYLSDAGVLRCATNAAGTWDAEDVVSGLTEGTPTLALAIAPDGARRIAFHDPAAGRVRLAAEGDDGWSVEDVATTSTSGAALDVEVAGDGVVNVLAIVDGSIVHASDASGTWQTTIVVDASAGSVYPVIPGELALDGDGNAWITYVMTWQFWDTLACATNRTGSWTHETVGTGSSSAAIAIADDGVARTATGEGAVRRHVRAADGTWSGRDLDYGFGVTRGFTTLARTEDEGSRVTVAVGALGRTSRTSGGSPQFAAAFDTAGALHGFYVVRGLDDLRYVTDRDPGTRSAFLDVASVGGTAGEADTTFARTRIAWRDADDTGVRSLSFDVVEDATAEPNETLILSLADPSGGIAALPGDLSLTLRDTPGSPPPPPPPPPPPEPEDHAYALATRFRGLPRGRTLVTGVLHVGQASFDPSVAPRIDVGAIALDFDAPAQGRGGAWTSRAGGSRLVVRPDPRAPGTWRFELRMGRDAGEPDLGGALALRYRAGEFDGGSTLYPAARRLDLAHGVGGFTEPALHVVALDAVAGEDGRLELTAYVADLGPAPQPMEDVSISVTPGFETVVDGDAFRAGRRGTFTASSDGARVTIDFERRIVRARFRGVDVASPGEGEPQVTVTIRVGALERTVVTPVRVRGARFSR